MLNELEEKALILVKRRPPGVFFFRRNFRFRNFGDEISPVLVAAILHKKFPDVAWRLKAQANKLLAIGSIMHFAVDGDVVWGTGVNGKVPEGSYRFSNLDVRGVRGPRSREFLRNKGVGCPKIFGDPALLAPKYLKKPIPDKERRDFIVIPHYHDQSLFEGVDNLVSPLQSYQTVLNRIVSSKRVISSSLHGVILAEAYGVPAVLVLPKNDDKRLFKYLDYYEGTQRANIDVAFSFDEAVRMKGHVLPSDYSVRALEEAFPSDFWASSKY